VLALRVVGIGVVGEGLLAVQFEDIRRQRNTLRVSQAPVQVNHDSHTSAPSQQALTDGQELGRRYATLAEK
jgi:hypothetical protein